MPGWKQILYQLAPWHVKEELIALEAKRINHYRRYGDYEVVRRAYDFSRYEALSPVELEEYQLQRVRALIRQARERSPFYRQRLPADIAYLEDLQQLPILTKQDVREHRGEILCAGYRPDELFHDMTSGSTGMPLHFEIGRDGMRIRFAVIDSYLAYFGCPYGERRLRFGAPTVVPVSRKKPPYWVFNRVDNSLHMSIYHLGPASLAHYVEALNAFEPVYSTGYPHIQYLLARYLCEHNGTSTGLQRPLRAAFCDSEQLLPQDRAVIEQGFGAPCYDAYGCHEMNWVAVHCRKHRHHALQLTSYLEVVDEAGQPLPPGEIGRLVVTDLTQQAFPFIRYDTGDVGAISREPCDCGWHSIVLDGIEGRADDLVVTPQGRWVGHLTRVVDPARGIVESQIVQTDLDRIVIRVVPTPAFEPASMQAVLAMARESLGDGMRVEWEAVDSIPRTNRQKFKFIVREIELPR